MTTYTTGEYVLRKENVDTAIKGFALQEWKIKNVVTDVSSNAWKETFYQETATELTATKGIPRLANFPNAQVSWTKVSSYIDKYGLSGMVSYEDAITDDLDVIARTILRISRAVVKSVEDEIYSVLSEAGSPSTINSVTSGVWNTNAGRLSGSAILAINEAIRKIEQNNYDMSSGGALLVSPTDYESLMNTIYTLGAQAPRMGEQVLGSRKFPTIMDLAIIKSNSVSVSGALVVKMKDCGTWRNVVPLTTITEYTPGVSYNIKAWTLGVTQLTNPKAVAYISGTQA